MTQVLAGSAIESATREREYILPQKAAARRRDQDNNDMPRDGGSVGRARLPKRLCAPRSRNTISTLPTLPAVVHLALVVVWLWATTSNAQVVGTVNQGTGNTASGE